MIPRKFACMSSYTGLLLCGTCLAALPGEALAATYYVAPNGSNSNNGSAASPWNTLQASVSHLQPGDTLNVEPGTYVGFIVGWDSAGQGVYGAISGTADHPITIQADPAAAGSVIINSRSNKTPNGIDLEAGCNYITISGFTITSDGSISHYGIKVAQSDHVNILNNTTHGVGRTGIFTSFASDGLIKNNVSYNNGEHGFYASNSPQNEQILNNIAHDNASGGIQVNADASQGGPGTAQNLTIANNIVYNNGAKSGGALNFDGLQNSVVENNLLYNNHASGIVLYDGDASAGSIKNIVVNNTVVQASGARPALNNNTNSNGNTFVNNIFLGDMLVDSSSTPAVFSNNLLLTGYTNKGVYVFPVSIVATAPALFANPSGSFANAGDYQLKSGSPAIDKGTSTDAPAMDIIGTARPQGTGFDIGAYEYVSGTPNPSPAPPPSPTPAPAPSPVVSAPTAAAITAITTNCQAPCADNFTGSAQGSNLGTVTYSWMFGDNTTGSGASASHTYASAGSYNVTLVASNTAGSASATKAVTVTAPAPTPTPAPSPVPKPPTVSASANVTSGNAPLAVKFSATASDPNAGGTITSYSWSFGDGKTSTSHHPSHTYTKVGSYTAMVTVTDSSSLTASSSVTVKVTGIPPMANPTWSVVSTKHHRVQFAANASDPDTVSANHPNGRIGYKWSFGDGKTSTAHNPTHAYATAGTYAATLTVTDNSGLSVTKTLSVTVP